MTTALAHRGPDDTGHFVNDHVSLGHRRLSIIDLGGGHQPLRNEDGSMWLVFNGEIYNFVELRRTLEGLGHVFATRCDSEVILHAYEQWGTACLERLRGMFAFAIWNEKRRELFLARDRMGIKPLYYAQIDGQLIFASEIKAMLHCPTLPRSMNSHALPHFLGYEFIPEPETIFENVFKLEAARWLKWRDGRLTTGSYWALILEETPRSDREHEAVFRDSMQGAVRSHLVSDVPIGVFLSGGLDSTSVVACIKRCGVDNIRTFSLGYADASYSELEYARIASRAYGTHHQETVIDPVTPEVIEQVIWHSDEPMSELSMVPSFLLCKEVAEHVKVCLSGEGGDELLAGYDRFRASKAHGYFRKLPEVVRRRLVEPFILKMRDRPQKKGAVNMLKRFIEGGLLPETGEHIRWQYFSTDELEAALFLSHVRNGSAFDRFAPIHRHINGHRFRSAVDRELYIETRFTMVNNALFKADRMSMAHGLEVRVPLLDHHFVEACASIPSRLKLRGFQTKAILRSAMRGILPDAILDRGKQGYSLPIKNWLRDELREYLVDTLERSTIITDCFNRRCVQRLIEEHQSKQANHNHILWALLNLAVWHRLFMESDVAETPSMEMLPAA